MNERNLDWRWTDWNWMMVNLFLLYLRLQSCRMEDLTSWPISWNFTKQVQKRSIFIFFFFVWNILRIQHKLDSINLEIFIVIVLLSFFVNLLLKNIRHNNLIDHEVSVKWNYQGMEFKTLTFAFSLEIIIT